MVVAAVLLEHLASRLWLFITGCGCCGCALMFVTAAVADFKGMEALAAKVANVRIGLCNGGWPVLYAELSLWLLWDFLISVCGNGALDSLRPEWVY